MTRWRQTASSEWNATVRLLVDCKVFSDMKISLENFQIIVTLISLNEVENAFTKRILVYHVFRLVGAERIDIFTVNNDLRHVVNASHRVVGLRTSADNFNAENSSLTINRCARRLLCRLRSCGALMLQTFNETGGEVMICVMMEISAAYLPIGDDRTPQWESGRDSLAAEGFPTAVWGSN